MNLIGRDPFWERRAFSEASTTYKVAALMRDSCFESQRPALLNDRTSPKPSPRQTPDRCLFVAWRSIGACRPAHP